MGKEKEGFSPEFKKVLEAIKNWELVRRDRSRSLIASFMESGDRGRILGDTKILIHGGRDTCEMHLKILERHLDELIEGQKFLY